MSREASTEEVNSLRQEQRDELEGTMVGAGNVGPFTKGMNRGLSLWVPICTVIGALLGLALGPAVMEDGVILMVIIGAVAGAVFGFTVGGFVGSRRRGEGNAGAADPGVARSSAGPPSERSHDGSPPAAPSSHDAGRLIRD